jgi:hypothetical protein
MLNACGFGVDLRYATSVVEDPAARRLQAVVPADDAVELTVEGVLLAVPDGDIRTVTDLRIESHAVAGSVARARVERTGATLTIHVLPQS